MRLFLDASLSPGVARELRGLGRRIGVARDYDMSELVLRGFAQAEGVVIIAFDFSSAPDEAKRIASELKALGERAKRAVHVFEPAGVRSRPYDIASG